MDLWDIRDMVKTDTAKSLSEKGLSALFEDSPELDKALEEADAETIKAWAVLVSICFAHERIGQAMDHGGSMKVLRAERAVITGTYEAVKDYTSQKLPKVEELGRIGRENMTGSEPDPDAFYA